MNINSIQDNEITVPKTRDEILKGIFNRQAELHEKYKHIEHENGLGLGLVSGDFDIDSPNWQYLLKDYAWRVTEEITEALEAREKGDKIHEVEELIDSLHFYTELIILCGYGPEDIPSDDAFVFQDVNDPFGCIYHLGLACNLLKNKPWKNTHLITDSVRFKQHLVEGYKKLVIHILVNHLDTFHNLYMVYYKKSLVNSFRIESNY